MHISNRVDRIGYSITNQLKEGAQKRKQQGKKVIDLGLGDVQFGLAQSFKKGLVEAAEKNINTYTHSAGTQSLREAITHANNTLFNGLLKNKITQPEYSSEEIVHNTSGKLLIYAAVLSLCDHGDDAMVLAPFWPPYLSLIKLAGVKPIIAKTEFKNNFAPTKNLLEKSLTKKTKIIIINSPNNPSGRVFTKQELKTIADFAKKHNVFIISDEVYNTITFANNFHQSIASLNQDALKRTIIIKSLSKKMGLGGARFGYAAGKNKRLIEAMIKTLSNITTSPPSFIQYAAQALFSNPGNQIEKIRAGFEKRTDFASRRLKKIGLEFNQPEGAFYLFPDVSPYFNKAIKTSTDFSYRLLDSADVVVLPGDACGGYNHVRIALIHEEPVLGEAFDRLEKFLKEI